MRYDCNQDRRYDWYDMTQHKWGCILTHAHSPGQTQTLLSWFFPQPIIKSSRQITEIMMHHHKAPRRALYLQSSLNIIKFVGANGTQAWFGRCSWQAATSTPQLIWLLAQCTFEMSSSSRWILSKIDNPSSSSNSFNALKIEPEITQQPSANESAAQVFVDPRQKGPRRGSASCKHFVKDLLVHSASKIAVSISASLFVVISKFNPLFISSCSAHTQPCVRTPGIRNNQQRVWR